MTRENKLRILNFLDRVEKMRTAQKKAIDAKSKNSFAIARTLSEEIKLHGARIDENLQEIKSIVNATENLQLFQA